MEYLFFIRELGASGEHLHGVSSLKHRETLNSRNPAARAGTSPFFSNPPVWYITNTIMGVTFPIIGE